MKVASFVYSYTTTIYGDHYDIITTNNTEDMAYTQTALTFHNDEPYYESPPGLSLLHCLKFDECVEGGCNVIVDGFAAAEEFRRDHPDEFDTLTKVPAIFGRISEALRRPAHMLYYRPHIVLGYDDQVVAINWTNSMQYGVCAHHDMVEPYYHARFKWYNFVKHFPINHNIRLSPGDLLAMNNRRVLHNRTKIVLNGGDRHVQGAIVNIDEFKSEVLAQCALQGHPLPKSRVGNQDYVC